MSRQSSSCPLLLVPSLWFSLEFFDSDDFGFEGEVDLEGFLNLVGDPVNPPSFNFDSNRMVNFGFVFENYDYAVFFLVFMSCGVVLDIECHRDVQ